MSKSKKLEWSFYLNDRGRKAYNTLCRRCVHDCYSESNVIPKTTNPTLKKLV